MGSTWIIPQVLLLAAAVADGSRTDSAALRQVAEGGATYTVQLFDTMLNETDGDLIFSPLSVQLALALLYPATRGDSAALLASALHLPPARDDVFAGYSALVATLKHPTLKIANRIFVDDTAMIKEEYKRNVEKYFDAGAQTVSFHKELAKSVNLINRWVEQATDDKIKDLIKPGSLDAATQVVLVNAIHFKANWKKQFETHNTLSLPFHVSKKKHVLVKTMHVNGHLNYLHDRNLRAKIVSLPFEGDRFAMLVVVPDEVDGLDAVVGRMRGGEGLNSGWRGQLRVEFMRLSLPKFKVEADINLNKVLQKHGLGALFSPAADLSGLSHMSTFRDRRLSVSKVVQKAVVDVTEGGVEAAASTAISTIFKSILDEPKVYLKADRPFLFEIHAVGGGQRHDHQAPLFVGRYSGHKHN